MPHHATLTGRFWIRPCFCLNHTVNGVPFIAFQSRYHSKCNYLRFLDRSNFPDDQGLKNTPMPVHKRHPSHSQCSWKIRKTRIETYRIFSDEFQEKPPLSFGSEGQSSSKCEGQQEKANENPEAIINMLPIFLMKESWGLWFGHLWFLNSFKICRTSLTQRHLESSSALRLP